MRDLSKYEGILPAFYATLNDEGTEIDTERAKANVRFLISKGVKGIYVNGSSGESIYLTVEDRKKLLEAVMEEARGKLTVIAHVAANSTKESKILAAHAESMGVDAIAAIPPIYFKLPPYSITKYWNDISSAAPNTDFIIYNIPQLAGVPLTMDMFEEMRKNPNMIGVKNSSMPIQDIQQFAQAGGDDIIVFNGADEQFIGGRVIGARAGIGGTYGVMPDLYVRLNELVIEGNMKTAKELQWDVDSIIYKMVSGKGNMYAIIKEILRINEDLNLGSVSAPLEPLHEEDKPIAQEAAKMIQEARAKYLK